MPVSKKSKTANAAVAKSQQKTEKKYPTARLLNSRHLVKYQRDFAKVILTEPEYTISEAVNALESVLKGGN